MPPIPARRPPLAELHPVVIERHCRHKAGKKEGAGRHRIKYRGTQRPPHARMAAANLVGASDWTKWPAPSTMTVRWSAKVCSQRRSSLSPPNAMSASPQMIRVGNVARLPSPASTPARNALLAVISRGEDRRRVTPRSAVEGLFLVMPHLVAIGLGQSMPPGGDHHVDEQVELPDQ